jgi:heat shock protein HslJ
MPAAHKHLLGACAVLSLCAALMACATVAPAVASVSGTTASFENTYWKLVALRGKPVEVAQQQREPHLILQPAQKRMAGSGGCNRLAGSYTLDDDRVSFGRVASTRMACAQGMEQESAFLDALSAIKRWRVEGQHLDLMDERGEVIAQFESRYLP